MTCLCGQPAAKGDSLCPDCGERAAILEYEGGLTKEEAEEKVTRVVSRR
jgi:uncharacterized Zn finger protein (UPF0148 family)